MTHEPKRNQIPQNRHYLDVSANFVFTATFQLIALNIEEAIEINDICLITGPAGVGKTFAARRTLHELEQRGAIAPTTFLREERFRSAPTVKMIAERLTKAITGVSYNFRTEREYTEILLDALSNQTVLVLDEAHFLTPIGMHYTRFLFDELETQLTLILVGGPTAYSKIRSDDHLSSRMGNHIPVKPLTMDEVEIHAPKLHPLLAGTSMDEIKRIDDFARGRFRGWMKFLRKAERICAVRQLDHIDDGVSKAVFNRIGDLAEPRRDDR